MLVGVLTLELYLGEVCSLKGKRQVLRSLLERLKQRYNVSVAEVGQQDSWKFATVGISVVSGDMAQLDKMLDVVLRFIDNHHEVEIINMRREVY